MKKSLFVLVYLILIINIWNISFFYSKIKNDGFMVLTLLWLYGGYFFYYSKFKTTLGQFKYFKYAYGFLLAIFISAFSAKIFWGQSISDTFVSQRFIYEFAGAVILLLIVEPSDQEVKTSLKWISIGTMLVWVLSVFRPDLIWVPESSDDKEVEIEAVRIGMYVNGIHLTLLYLYFLIQDYIKSFTIKKFLWAFILIAFFVLYYNRSMLMGIMLVLLYSLTRIKTSQKVLIFSLSAVFIVIGFYITLDFWISVLERSQSDLSNTDYNRWKALDYFLFDFSPNWFCYIFGNGMPSGGNSSYGNLMWANMENGIYSSDLGLIGMWAYFGIIPLFIIYYIIIKVFSKPYFPLSLKFICFHVLLVPTIFEFNSAEGMSFFSMYIYLFAYYNEFKDVNYAGNNSSKLQK